MKENGTEKKRNGEEKISQLKKLLNVASKLIMQHIDQFPSKAKSSQSHVRKSNHVRQSTAQPKEISSLVHTHFCC